MKDNSKDDNKYVLISFQSSHHAIYGEKVAESATESMNCKIDDEQGERRVRLIPLPPEISAGCGLVLKLPFSFLQGILDVFKSESIAFEDIFVVECNAGRSYTKLSLE